ncbi:MAG: PadR family transcriptional regulator [Clostridia bacterium]|nr:PadR family transcriptional regulator [Clostridia bacterium]
MDIQLKRGLLEVCVLAALLGGESYGYALVKDISACVEISESTLYPILRRLESASLLTVDSREHNGRLRKYYAITPAGRARVEDFVNEQRDMMRVFRFIEEKKGANHDQN